MSFPFSDTQGSSKALLARQRGRALTLLALVFLGCASPQTHGRPPRNNATGSVAPSGSVEGALHLGDTELPPAPQGLDLESDPLQRAWQLATQTSLIAPPPLPANSTLGSIERWASEDFHAWIQIRAEALRDAVNALRGQGERAPSAAEATFRAGVAAQLYRNFAEDILSLQSPRRFQDNAPSPGLFRRLMEESAQPLLERALDAYGSCASLAASQPVYALERWRRFCDHHRGQLQRSLDEESPESRGEGVASPAQP